MSHSIRSHIRKPISAAKRLMQRRRRSKGRRRGVVEKKVRKLQRIIPGGQETVHPDRLFDLTANYILHLRLQINLLHALSKVYSSHV
ncbi:transcription factor PAR2-like [Silene latifolia]|uniref:transcription factor PAR2-like n=1 Tax=Silene latifolia TaxID=37657 RepID=UPI003D777DA5